MVISRHEGQSAVTFLACLSCRPVTRFDCHSSAVPFPAPSPRPAPAAGGGEKKRSVEMRLCAPSLLRSLAFWDDNYGSNYNEFVPDSGREQEGAM